MKPAQTLGAYIFLVMALGHTIRTFTAWHISIDGLTVPVWFSAFAALGFAALAVLMFREQRA
jgi:hypothetical protein